MTRDAAPIRLDHFMARANAAYYSRRDPFADFITSPEISQMFGELLGAWVAVTWQRMGAPDPFVLAEAGPGRGTLMADALRLLSRVAPACYAAARVHMVETSPRLRQAQAAALTAHADVVAPVWLDAVPDLPPGPLVFIANEFLDALPIRQFVRTAHGWDERMVTGEVFVTRPATDLPAFGPLATRDVPEGEVLEVCEGALCIARQLGARLSHGGGVALFIDYGYDGPGWGDTLQALCDGRPAWPLARPGMADLTAHVDFAALATAARDGGCATWGSVTQGAFLSALGLFPRAAQLARNQPGDVARQINEAAQRLAAPDRMGGLFRVMAMTAPDMTEVAGFEGLAPLVPGRAGMGQRHERAGEG
ncbi:class I SAM-dependent methyltransferase [Novacetimonas pomaceti]|uniref:Methyltransferase n=1 Tax=Novacetimonas pomaceti TaxID=2021998 RepID=A0A318Q901_9PROT|nr:SAM-dependent methyltransferase [Novacetimonas pomaceti]PYD76116.1 methyltransferase [Novacetimonas pomaceti]